MQGRNYRHFLLSLSFIIFISFSYAQESLWSTVEKSAAGAYIDGKKNKLPSNYQLLLLNTVQAKKLQTETPLENHIAGRQSISKVLFNIPLPGETDFTGNIAESPLLSPELQKQNLQIKTYQLSNPSTGNSAGRISISPSGITGILFTDKGSFYISPLGNSYPGVHMIFNTKDLDGGAEMLCGVTELAELKNAFSANRLTAGDCQLRTFRLAVAATGEYTTAFGSQANALTGITNTINIVNAIYERDVNVHFTLVTNNSVVFTNAATDPYPTIASPDANTLTQNQTALNTGIGNGNYDLGIVFNDGWSGGLASVSVVCNNASKGRAAAGANDIGYIGLGGPVFASTVAHEIAHQFSATHTFSASNAPCGTQATASTAYEPGGGSTIMAYAGVCNPNFYQRQSDLYFHTATLELIQNYLLSGSASCAVISSTGNTAPVVSVAASSYTIPRSTPFSLTASGSDANGNTLKFGWEQLNANLLSATAPSSTNINGPNFRSYAPGTNPTRVFPSIESLVLTPNPYEVLPGVARTMNFRVTARDEAAGGGCTAEADVAVVVDGTTGPFQVNTQNSPVTLAADGVTTFTVGWDVNGTTGGTVNCATVDILFSTDGGYTYPNTLLSNTPNDGSLVIVIPNLPTAAGRIKVQAHSNIFFDINNANITITSACVAEAATFTPSANVTASSGNVALDLNLSPAFGSPLTPNGTVAVTDPVGNLPVLNIATSTCTDFDQPYYHDQIRFFVTVGGNYTIQRTGGGLVMNLYGSSFSPGTPCQNFITSNAQFDPNALPDPTVSLSSGFSVTLIPNTYYVLTIGSFNGEAQTLPIAYSINVTPPPGGNIYAASPSPGAGYSYTYVIVENATGNIKAIDPGADLSNPGTYPSGVFTVYGLSYSNASAGALPGFVGGSFAALQNSLLFNPTSTCGNLSKNSITASVQSTVPLKLFPLKAYKVDKKVLLKWGTAFEQNTDRYEIERSTDGNQFNKMIGTVKAAGNSNITLNYDFTDALPENDINYYRIKQFDIDGQFSYTNVAKVNMKSSALQLNLYPSPVVSQLTLEYYSGRNENVMVDIIDSKGSVVSRLRMNMLSGVNIKTINVNQLSNGIYMMKISTQSEVITSRFIKN